MLGIIIVDYKSAPQTIDYVRRELSKLDMPRKVVICSNAADADSDAMFRRELDAQIVGSEPVDKSKDVFVLSTPENLGFARGNNRGAEFLRDNFDCTYLLFSNNDIVLRDPQVVDRLIGKLKADSTIGMIGPEVVGLDGRRQSPEPYVGLWNRYIWMYVLTPFMSRAAKNRRFCLNYSRDAAEGPHYRIMGSFFIMPSEAFFACGMMDPHTFLYAEEMILSERLASIGRKVYFLPSTSVVHAHGLTTGKYLQQKKKLMIGFDANAYYYRTYRGYSALSVAAARFLYGLVLNAKSMLGRH